MKKKILALITIVATVICFTGCIRITSTHPQDDESYEIGQGTISQDISEIEIQWISGEVNIVYEDRQDISFFEDSGSKLDEDQMLHYRVDGDTLEISFAEPTFSSANFPDKNLTLSLPASLQLENLDVDNVSATVTIKDAAYIDELELDTVAGNIIAWLPAGVGEVSCNSISGNVEFYIPDRGFTAEFESVSGLFNGDFATTLSGQNYVYADGSISFDLGSVSGNASIMKLA